MSGDSLDHRGSDIVPTATGSTFPNTASRQFGDHSSSGSIMGLLPCLSRGADRWWLPLSPMAVTTLGQVLLRDARSSQQNSPALSRQLSAALRHDPALMIYAAVSSGFQTATIERLADWLAKNAAGRFANGSAFLCAPEISDEHTLRWLQLRDRFSAVNPVDWMREAHLWLEVAGPRVPDSWRDQWPAIQPDEQLDDQSGFDSDALHSASAMLSQLARLSQRTHSIEKSFDQRLHKNKLGSLKQLAYGLSHEINNPLANISTRAQQLQRGENDETRHAVLQRIVDQVYRAHEMIADLMFFAHPPTPHRQECELAEVVRGVLDSFREEAQRQVIRLQFDDGVLNAPKLEADPKMVGEAVRALIRNSIEAIGCEGTIAVSLDYQDNAWQIQIADSGPGLSDLARQHAFDPYFSGREAGRGLGLGLCRAYRIAKLHDGDIKLTGGPIGCVATILLRKK